MADHYTIRELTSLPEFRACVELQREVWGSEYAEVVPASILSIVGRLGGVVAGAFDGDGRLVGFVVGFPGLEGRSAFHWSDTLAVSYQARNQGLGTRLKLFQRQQVIRCGGRRVNWTFDPLESQNAYVNFAHLGVVAREYLKDVYGETNSELHAAIGTDRLVAIWHLASTRVVRRLAGNAPPPTGDSVADVPLANETRTGPTGLESLEPDVSIDATRVRIAIPLDIQAIKSGSLELARDWRRITRVAFEGYLGRGYTVTEVVRDGRRTCYLLESPGPNVTQGGAGVVRGS